MDRKANALDLDDYGAILRRVLAPGLHEMTAESKAQVDVLQDELSQFFKRYEVLYRQVVPGRAKQHEVLWVLSHRFFVPWLALRIAYRLPDDSDVGATAEDCWFVPLRKGALASSVMKVIDQSVRHKRESNARLAQRLHKFQPVGENKRRSVAQISEQANREDSARRLKDNISKYQHFKTSPPDEIIELVAARTSDVPHLRLILVLARFFDRCIRAALTIFDEGLLLELLNYFVICFAHFRRVLKQVRSEIPPDKRDKVWLWLTSRTFMGNTPGHQERFYPLMDEYMNELSRKINAELCRVVHSGKLDPLPHDDRELNAGRWQIPCHVPIPREIEYAGHGTSVSEAIAVSRRIFRIRINRAAAMRAKQLFEFLGLGTFVVTAKGRQGFCNIEDAKLAEGECKRLFQAIYEQAPAPHRPQVALEFLKYLIEPYRPKANEDRTLARNLFAIVRKPLRQENLKGAAKYLNGCLLALEGNHKKALNSFVAARKFGRESCGQFWIDLIRFGLMTAEHLRSKREGKNFAKQARLFGIFSNDATPRTNEMQAQMKEEDFRQAWGSAFKPFPRPTNAKGKDRLAPHNGR